MAQETAASTTVSDGGIFRAWTDALFHPQFETYARWYLKMNARWRRISLAVSLPLLLGAIFVAIAHDAMHIGSGIKTLTFSRFLSYLGSPHGLFEVFELSAGALLALFAIPATAALLPNHRIGRYRIRYYIAYCTFMQTLPVTSVFLIVSAVGYLVVGFFASTSFIDQAATYLFIGLPMLFALGLICAGLSAATLRHSFLVSWMIQAVYVITALFVWSLLGNILVSLGYPVF